MVGTSTEQASMTRKFSTPAYNRLLMILTGGWMIYWMILRLIARDVHGRVLRIEYIERWPTLLFYGLAVPLFTYVLLWSARAVFRWAFRDFLDVPER
jgi:hypothetical protein